MENKINDEILNKLEEKFKLHSDKVKDEIIACFDNYKKDIQLDLVDLVGQIRSIRKQVDIVTDRVKVLENESRECDVIINGVKTSENGEDLDHIFTKICTAIDFSLQPHLLIDIFRPKINHTKADVIIAKLFSSRTRSQFMQKYKAKGNLCMKDIGANSSNRIYCNEGLTKTNSLILNTARKLIKNGKLEKAFTVNGIVYAKCHDDNSAVKIMCMSDLDQLSSKLQEGFVNDQQGKLKPQNDVRRETRSQSSSSMRNVLSSTSAVSINSKSTIKFK